jgi:hypothetical protein
MKHFKYLSYVVRHKWFVFVECWRLGIPIRGIFHDMSKFLPSEWFPYVNFFYSDKPAAQVGKDGYYKPAETGDKAFDLAWLLHQRRNRHHWQWWLLLGDEDALKVLEMPEEYVREMVADWKGAGKAQGKPDTKAWYKTHASRIRLHPNTVELVENLLDVKRPKLYK